MKKNLSQTKSILSFTLVLFVIAGILGVITPNEASAQVRPAMVRDVDTPALQPFRANASVSLNPADVNKQALITTVPSGKRLVIENISWFGNTSLGGQIIFAGLRSPEYGTIYGYLPINAPHPSASPSFVLQDGSQPVKLYFEAGEPVWLSVSKIGDVASFYVVIEGYYITP